MKELLADITEQASNQMCIIITDVLHYTPPSVSQAAPR